MVESTCELNAVYFITHGGVITLHPVRESIDVRLAKNRYGDADLQRRRA